MKVKKFLKGIMAAALAVIMAVTPVSLVRAAEVTVTSGASTYTFSQEPVAAFVVSGWWNNPIILYCLPEGATIHSQAGSSAWECKYYSDEVAPDSYDIVYLTEWDDTEISNNGEILGGTGRSSDGRPYILFAEIFHSDISGFDAIYSMENKSWFDGEVYDLTAIPEVFALNGATAVQIPVADALAMDNANIQLDTANKQTAEAQAQAAQAEALAAQQAAEAQAQAEALAAQQAAEAAQAQAEAQQAAAQVQPQPSITSASQGTYTVEADDNLCRIAQKVYGDMKAWREIYKANPTIKDDYVIYKGQVLVIPAR